MARDLNAYATNAHNDNLVCFAIQPPSTQSHTHPPTHPPTGAAPTGELGRRDARPASANVDEKHVAVSSQFEAS